ncbi:MAG: hypothetical protein Q7S74_02560 [Nanoarchaeota archaeon]|nr:hypothetical protein [Nanoarchaeota archaeon]
MPKVSVNGDQMLHDVRKLSKESFLNELWKKIEKNDLNKKDGLLEVCKAKENK